MAEEQRRYAGSKTRPEFVPDLLQVRVKRSAVAQVPDLTRAGPASLRAMRLPDAVNRPFALFRSKGMLREIVPVFSSRTQGASLEGAPRAVGAAFATSVRDAEHDDLAGIALLRVSAGSNLAQVARQLENTPGIQYVHRVPARWLAKAVPDPLANRQWGLRAIGLFDAQLVSAARVDVAVLDTGVDAKHPDLKIARYEHPGSSAQDIIGHGTHVSGIIGAKTNNAVGITGIANCALHSWKIFGDAPAPDGEYYVDELMYQRALNAARNSGMHVMNLSIGGTASSQTERTLFRLLYESGCVVVAAMGNEYQRGNPVEYPAKYPNVLAVGATDEANRRAYFSNTGPHITLCAPGTHILSTLPTYASAARPNPEDRDYAAWDGTSMATPQVTGAVARFLAKNPHATVDDVRSRLASTATRVDGMKPRSRNSRYGAGLLNIARLVS